MIKQTIESDLKTALKAGNEVRKSTLRMLLAALKNKEIELGKKEAGLSDDEVLGVLRAEVKKRKDAIESFGQGGRADLVEREEAELAVLLLYLPSELSDDNLAGMVREAMKATGATEEKDFGAVMKVVMATAQGRADGKRVSEIVREELKRLA